MINETRKILHLENLPIVATCIRVPVENCHGVSMTIELVKKFEIEQIKQIVLRQGQGDGDRFKHGQNHRRKPILLHGVSPPLPNEKT